MKGYFGLAHRNNELANDVRHETSYVARFKHSLLFHPRLIIADHMVVNSPNFPRAFDRFPSFRELFRPELIEVAHLEQFKDGRYMSLGDLFEFYNINHALHPNFDRKYCLKGMPPFFEAIETTVGHIYPEAALRDPQFTVLCDEFAESESARTTLGSDYSAFQTAYGLLREDVPTLGIIHFDPEHRWKDDKTIFDYWAALPAFRKWPVTKIEAQFSPVLTPVFRALLVKVETNLMQCQAILPKELSHHQGLLLSSGASGPLELEENEREEIYLDLSACDNVETFAELPVQLLIDLRSSDEGQAFLNGIASMEAQLPVRTLRALADSYLKRINKDVTRQFPESKLLPSRRIRLVVSRGLIKHAGPLIEPVLGTLIQIGGLFHPDMVLLSPWARGIGQSVRAHIETQQRSEEDDNLLRAEITVAKEGPRTVTQYNT